MWKTKNQAFLTRLLSILLKRTLYDRLLTGDSFKVGRVQCIAMLVYKDIGIKIVMTTLAASEKPSNLLKGV